MLPKSSPLRYTQQHALKFLKILSTEERQKSLSTPTTEYTQSFCKPKSFYAFPGAWSFFFANITYLPFFLPSKIHSDGSVIFHSLLLGFFIINAEKKTRRSRYLKANSKSSDNYSALQATRKNGIVLIQIMKLNGIGG